MAMTRIEGDFRGYQDQVLFYQAWVPAKSNGTLVISHGQAEHSNCYHRLVSALEDFNWTILAWDMRGHGRSEGKRGFAENFSDYVLDFEKFLQQITPDYVEKGKPLVLLGHSMGGLVQLKALLNSVDGNVPVTAQVLSSPLLGLGLPVPAWKDKAAHLLHQFLPQVTMGNELKYSQLTRDLDIQKEYDHDVLRHDQISSGVYIGMTESIAIVQSKAQQIKLPSFFQIAGKDSVVSSIAAQEFFEKLGSSDKKMQVYKESLHEVYNDLDREEAFRDLKNFLSRFSEGGKA